LYYVFDAYSLNDSTNSSKNLGKNNCGSQARHLYVSNLEITLFGLTPPQLQNKYQSILCYFISHLLVFIPKRPSADWPRGIGATNTGKTKEKTFYGFMKLLLV
jgi:hypothetical protein